MLRLRLVLLQLFAVAACLAFAAAAAAAKPHSAKGHKSGSKSSSGLVVQAPKSARLTVGTTTKVKVGVVDHAHTTIPAVVLLAKASKGVTVKPAKVKVGRLTPGKKKVETFRVAVAATAIKPKVEFVAKAPGAPKAHDAVALKMGAGKPDEKEEAKKTPAIIGRYFWSSETVLTTTYLHGYYFVDEDWVYRGLPKNGLPSCTSQTAQGEEDGCLPYTWDETTGALNIAGTTGEYRIDSHHLEVGEDGFGEAVPPEAGTEIEASGSYGNEFGICPTACSSVTADLEMSSSGEFARGSGVAGLFAEGGSYGALPPEDHGTYSIDARGHIVFTYADGEVISETIAFMLDANGDPDPNFGMILDQSDYFGPDSGV